MVVNCLSSWDTEYSADTVEWCTQPKYNDVFAVGTYQVDNDPNSSKFDGQSQRKGRLYLGEFKDEIDIKQTIETPAILDLKWSPNNQGALAAVNASGQLTIYSLKENISLEDAKSFNIDGNDLLILSLAWKHDRIALSDSGGYITVVSSDQDMISEQELTPLFVRNILQESRAYFRIRCDEYQNYFQEAMMRNYENGISER
ncbi:DPH7 [Lepeophtheirus salmonis]|uniref:DPH7 n=1 Tax=Lepeophtheirus salmonis TaxID=72036 RepID=A0A7R8HA87_LEPSM|nr:DPH7 [Lepeophtheirus salmonis]CAF2972108.1 DPH7 [Lepeophtheirus salmonis]